MYIVCYQTTQKYKVLPKPSGLSSRSAMRRGAENSRFSTQVSYKNVLMRFKVDAEEMTALPLRRRSLSKESMKYFGACCDGLIIIQTRSSSTLQLFTLELKSDTCWWILKCCLNLETIGSAFPEIEYIFKYNVLCVVKGEKTEDYALVLAIPGNVITYTMERNTLFVFHDLALGNVSAGRRNAVFAWQSRLASTRPGHQEMPHGTSGLVLGGQSYQWEPIRILRHFASSIDTPLPGHPVVVTTAPHSGHASINGIKVTEWDMYNDGCVIVHGVEDFFDPAFQTLLYRRYDNNNSSNKNGINKSGVDEAVSSSSRSTTPWQKDMTVDKLFIMLAVVSLAGSVLSLVLFCYWANRRYSEYSFICTEV
ncbi:hypothetical protein RHSIM_Rhsim01G0018500 [Rhododendron simsii]|uniref:Uncharacterized protein n=1 Tax=Rhododendron simsii TaxID=118357 RepID=A0A834HEG0_RHOSS|nr:hypothetical protein RHSIM_Rhsim01G0018500 [Rhododendron simsii]